MGPSYDFSLLFLRQNPLIDYLLTPKISSTHERFSHVIFLLLSVSLHYAYFPFSAVGGDSYITSSPYRLLDTDHRIVIPTLPYSYSCYFSRRSSLLNNSSNRDQSRRSPRTIKPTQPINRSNRFIPIAIEAIPIKKFLQVILAFVPTDPMFRSIDLINQFVLFNFPEILFFSAGIDPKNE